MKWIDRIGDWLVHELSAHAQLRLGVLLFLGSLPLYPAVFFVDEPPLIFLMSAAALTLTGIGIVLGAELLVTTEDVAEDHAEHCNSCGQALPRQETEMDMDPIVTEKSVDNMDLPHQAVWDGQQSSPTKCECGRTMSDDLHNPQVTETAAHGTPALQTEKGS